MCNRGWRWWWRRARCELSGKVGQLEDGTGRDGAVSGTTGRVTQVTNTYLLLRIRPSDFLSRHERSARWERVSLARTQSGQASPRSALPVF